MNCQSPKRRCTLIVAASYHVCPWPLLRDQTFRNCGNGRSDWASVPLSGKFAYGFLKPAATTAGAVIGCCSSDPRIQVRRIHLVQIDGGIQPVPAIAGVIHFDQELADLALQVELQL